MKNFDKRLEKSLLLTIAVSCAFLAFMLTASWFTYLILTA
jgi:Na+/H+ antiporter NhaC